MPPTDSRLRIVVTGLAALHPVGGVAWDYLQYVIGLHRLGHDVYYFEDTWSWPYHPIRKTQVPTGDYSAQMIGRFFDRYEPGCSARWQYLHLHNEAFGMTKSALNKVLASADLFVNVSGANILPENLSEDCIKLFLDTDPGYNQVVMSEKFSWSENVDRWCNNIAAHDRYFTYAENIHGADCEVPTVGLEWQTTRMPVVLDLWSEIARERPPLDSPWTTVMTWNAFKGPVTYQGVELKSKGAEFGRLINLPARVDQALKIAIGGKNAPIEQLSAAGWIVQDGPTATLTPEEYRGFIRFSRGEVSTAKHIYRKMRTGWFSCRSACYLAAGRPVVVQDTGFGDILPCGEGVMTFESLEGAASALAEVEADYPRHSKAALEISSQYFGSEKVLRRLIEDAMAVEPFVPPLMPP
jgi:hypothetical protein